MLSLFVQSLYGNGTNMSLCLSSIGCLFLHLFCCSLCLYFALTISKSCLIELQVVFYYFLNLIFSYKREKPIHIQIPIPNQSQNHMKFTNEARHVNFYQGSETGYSGRMNTSCSASYGRYV